MQLKPNPQNTDKAGTSPFLSSRAVMARFGYKNNSAFFAFVRAQGVPFVRLNARKLVFDPASLEAWVSKRSVGTRA